jgi:hypothetical protein
MITTNGSTVSDALGGVIEFAGSSTAANATCLNSFRSNYEGGDGNNLTVEVVNRAKCTRERNDFLIVDSCIRWACSPAQKSLDSVSLSRLQNV